MKETLEVNRNGYIKPPSYKQVAPYACPICHENGLVPNGFYNPEISKWECAEVGETCRACGGRGIVWG